MRIVASVVAWWSAFVLGCRIVWPKISSQPFPLPGYQNMTLETAHIAIAVAAVIFALWISLFWRHARSHQWMFVFLSALCFLWGALFISVPVGLGFAILSVIMRSK